MLSERSFKRVRINSAEALLAFSRKLPPQASPQWWLFRGMRRDHDLQTSLERVLVESAIPLDGAEGVERKLLKLFKRRAHHHVHPLPSDGDTLGWLALMQHYGAPTRLLDWTYSFYVAAFFALAESTSTPPATRAPAVVWALYREAFKLTDQAPVAGAAYDAAVRCGSVSGDTGRSDADTTYDGILAYLQSVMEKPEPSIWAVNSYRLNERVSVQQGVFLCPGDVRVPFEDNLRAGHPSSKVLVRFEFSARHGAMSEMLEVLNRMNVNFASLFPGLDGFARSLRQAPWIRGMLRPDAASHK